MTILEVRLVISFGTETDQKLIFLIWVSWAKNSFFCSIAELVQSRGCLKVSSWPSHQEMAGLEIIVKMTF